MGRVDQAVEWANANQGILTLVLSGMSLIVAATLAVSTAIYVRLTSRLVTETTSLRRVETDPHVVVFLERPKSPGNLLNLVVRNIGRGAAYDIRCSFNPDMVYEYDEAGRRTITSPFDSMADGLTFLAPGQEREYSYGPLRHAMRQEAFTAHVRYSAKGQEADRRTFSEAFIINVREFGGLVRILPDSELDVPGHLGRIAASLEIMATSRAPQPRQRGVTLAGRRLWAWLHQKLTNAVMRTG